MAAESEGRYAVDFIEQHCRITRGPQAGSLVQLLPFQKELLSDLLELRDDGMRRYRRAYVQCHERTARPS